MNRKLIALLVIASVVILIAGCSGGDNATKTDTGTKGSPTDTGAATSGITSSQTATTPSSTTSGTETTDKEVPRKMEYAKGTLPADVESVLNNGVPVIVAFYESNDRISERMKPIVAQVAADYDEVATKKKGLIRYFSYTDAESKAKTRLSLTLGVNYLPHVSVIDRNKNIVFEKSGFFEYEYLEHALYNTIYRDIENK